MADVTCDSCMPFDLFHFQSMTRPSALCLVNGQNQYFSPSVAPSGSFADQPITAGGNAASPYFVAPSRDSTLTGGEFASAPDFHAYGFDSSFHTPRLNGHNDERPEMAWASQIAMMT